MLCVVQPFAVDAQLAYVWPLIAAFCYAGFAIITRHVGPTERATLLAVTAQCSFLVASGLFGLALGHGEFAGHTDPGIEFFSAGMALATSNRSYFFWRYWIVFSYYRIVNLFRLSW